MLTSLRLQDVGPAPHLTVDLKDRLNVFTGDNGLGKTFVLDIAWWALTGDWSGLPAWPRRAGASKGQPKLQPQIEYQLKRKNGQSRLPIISRFDPKRQQWPRPDEEADVPALVVYARIDGGFSIWDPARKYVMVQSHSSSPTPWDLPPKASYHFTSDAVWNGLTTSGAALCNGLIRDWVNWQYQPKTSPFEVLRTVIKGLAPSADEPIEIGPPIRISPVDVRDIPTLTLSYGDVPVTHVSAGIKRIISFAYLLTWAWDEHKRASEFRNQEPVRDLVLLIDEIELHLHPRWQRTLLPSLLRTGNTLKAEFDLQVLGTTHAPLVLASAEPDWNEARDALFSFELNAGNGRVSLSRLPWAKLGDAAGWLMSPVFGLDQARSKDAEIAIEAAEAYMRGDKSKLPKDLRTKASIDKALRKSLGDLDPFWPRWVVNNS